MANSRYAPASGISLSIAGVLLPVVTRAIGNGWITRLVKTDPVPQSAMAFAFLTFCGSLLIAAGLIGIGIALIWRSRH